MSVRILNNKQTQTSSCICVWHTVCLISNVKGNDTSGCQPGSSANETQGLQTSADAVTSAVSQSMATICGHCRLTAAVEYISYSLTLFAWKQEGGGSVFLQHGSWHWPVECWSNNRAWINEVSNTNGPWTHENQLETDVCNTLPFFFLCKADQTSSGDNSEQFHTS